ncbi:hypothetical protein ACFEMC_03295 [Kineococcus sp. DHX-1]|uniref:hypothetical protein n=1 Tax=Kineococcus sp. DHX-1 TaxID=3349638 RepID=UPI0036D2F23D
MAGGQLRRNGQRPLHEVVRRQQVLREQQSRGEQPAVRHCWVRAPDGGDPWPGIVVAWVRGPAGWRGRVVYVVPGKEPVLVEAWVEAQHLRPVVVGDVSGG